MSVSRHHVPLGTAKLWAKRLKNALAPSSFPAPLALCQQSLAQMLGFEHWHELQKNLGDTSKPTASSPLPDLALDARRPIRPHTGALPRLGYDYPVSTQLEEGLSERGGWILAGTAKSGRTRTLQALASTAHASEEHPLVVWDSDRDWPAPTGRWTDATDNATVIRLPLVTSVAHRETLLASVTRGDLVVNDHRSPIDPVLWTSPRQQAYRMFSAMNVSSEWAILDRLEEEGVREKDLRDHQPTWWLGYQWLVPELCNSCAKPLEVEVFLDGLKGKTKQEWRAVFQRLPSQNLRTRGPGCEHCHRTHIATPRVGYAGPRALANWVKMDDAGWAAWHRCQKSGGLARAHFSEEAFGALQFQGRDVALGKEPVGQASLVELALWRIIKGLYDPHDFRQLFGPHALHFLVVHMGWSA